MRTTETKHLRIYVFLALVSLFATLWLPHIGEEGVYTISAFEMWFNHQYLVNTLYGGFYGRPPLLNWFVIPLANGFGWQHVLIASRLISAFSTVFVALSLYWFVNRIIKNVHVALLSTAIYLTGDLLFVRGWLAYADPLLSLFIFLSIAFLWLAVEERRNTFFLVGVMALGAAFLVKAMSPYWFYGLAGLVLLCLHKNRGFLLRPASILIHIAALTMPFIWNIYADPRYLPAMWVEVANTAFIPSLGEYIYQVVIAQPVMLLLRLAPISVIALYYYFKKVKGMPGVKYVALAKIAFWMALLNFAVCWFAPRWPEARYYMPVFPLMAISMAYVIWNAGEKAQKITGALLLLTLFLKAVMSGYFYYRYIHLEPNYRNVAKDILHIVGNAPLTVDRYTCQSAPVEQVAIHLNVMRYPKKPLQYAPESLRKTSKPPYTLISSRTCQGLYMVGQKAGTHDRIIARYSMGKQRVYLLCRS